jgi:hypothetical protein
MSTHNRPEPLKRAEHVAEEVLHGAERLAERVSPASERDLIQRVFELPARKQLLLARKLWTDPRVHQRTRLPMIAGTVYMLLPIRFLPRRFALIRPLEKLIGLCFFLWLIARLTPEAIIREHLDTVEGTVEGRNRSSED